MNCLGIDLGSSSIKGAMLDVSAGTIRNVRSRPFPQPLPHLPPGHFEIDPLAVLVATRALLEELLSLTPSAEAVFFASQMAGVVCVAADGEPVGNYISWRDQRAMAADRNGTNMLATVERRLSPEQLAEIGNELKPGSVTVLLYALQEQLAGARQTRPLTLGSYVISALCGTEPVVDPTEAIGTLDVPRGDWHHGVFQSLGLSEFNWPRLANYRVPCGTIELAGRRLVCHPSVGDHPASLLGVGLVERELSINVSTGSQVSLLSRDARLGAWQSRASFDGAHLNTITHLPAGRALNALVDLLSTWSDDRSRDVWPEILAAVDAMPDTDLDVTMSFFAGPLGDRGRIDRITLENLTPGGLFLAAFRNMADNYRRCAERLAACGDWERVVLSGGLAQRSGRLRQLIGEKFSLPVRMSPDRDDDTLHGLLQLARRVYG